MAITRDDVLHVAKLARLELSEAEISPLQAELSAILDHVEQLSELDLEGVSEMRQPTTANAPLRADRAKDGLTHEQALAASQRTAHGGFAVPSYTDES